MTLEQWLPYTERMGSVLVIILSALVAFRYLAKAASLISTKLPFLPTGMILPIGRTAIGILATILCLSTLLGMSPMVLISGIGLSAGMIAFALKDVIANFLTGVKILAEGNIKVGQVVELKRTGLKGRVRDVSLSKVMLDQGKKITIIPIHEIAKDIISIPR